jgi:hypothetical protein
MGTGVGEAMLIGAAVGATAGGAGAAIQGGDPLKGALTGGAMGAVGGGLGAGFGAAGGTAAGGASGAAGGAAGGTSGATFGTLGAGAGSGIGFSAGVAPGAVGGSTLGGTLGGATGGSLGAGSSVLAASANPALYGSSIGALGSAAPAVTGSAVSSLSPTTLSLTGSGAGNFTGFAPALSNTQLGVIGGTSALGAAMQAERNRFGVPGVEGYESTFDPSKFVRSTPTYAPESVYRPEYRDYTTAAEGGIMRLANGGPVERMSQMNTAMNPQGGLYPQGMIDKTQYATPTQRPVSAELMTETPAYERSNPMLMNEGGIAKILESAKAQGLSPEMYQNIYGRGNAIIEMEKRLKEGKAMNPGMASGGISSLGGYSDGGRMLKGPGDGMSDSIPGVIAGKQPARLADGEFVVPADVVSHLGNGSTDAGAKQLYAMMDKVRKARTGKKKQAPAVKANRYMPA